MRIGGSIRAHVRGLVVAVVRAQDATVDVAFTVSLLTGPAVTILIAAISQAAAVGRLHRNGTVGLRLPSLLRSDAAWRAGHRAVVRPAIAATVVLTAVSVVALLLGVRGVPQEPLTVAALLLMLAAVALLTVVAHRAASRTDVAA